MLDRPDRIVGKIPKNARETIMVSLKEKAGRLGADVRIAASTGHGPMRETAKGLRIPISQLGDVIRALQEAERLSRCSNGR